MSFLRPGLESFLFHLLESITSGLECIPFNLLETKRVPSPLLENMFPFMHWTPNQFPKICSRTRPVLQLETKWVSWPPQSGTHPVSSTGNQISSQISCLEHVQHQTNEFYSPELGPFFPLSWFSGNQTSSFTSSLESVCCFYSTADKSPSRWSRYLTEQDPHFQSGTLAVCTTGHKSPSFSPVNLIETVLTSGRTSISSAEDFHLSRLCCCTGKYLHSLMKSLKVCQISILLYKRSLILFWLDTNEVTSLLLEGQTPYKHWDTTKVLLDTSRFIAQRLVGLDRYLWSDWHLTQRLWRRPQTTFIRIQTTDSFTNRPSGWGTIFSVVPAAWQPGCLPFILGNVPFLLPLPSSSPSADLKDERRWCPPTRGDIWVLSLFTLLMNSSSYPEPQSFLRTPDSSRPSARHRLFKQMRLTVFVRLCLKRSRLA